MTEFEWDEKKRQSNLEKHRIDFLKARELFDGRDVYILASERGEELRYATTGFIETVMYTAIWTPRGEKIRLISVRRARYAEEREYRLLHGR